MSIVFCGYVWGLLCTWNDLGAEMRAKPVFYQICNECRSDHIWAWMYLCVCVCVCVDVYKMLLHEMLYCVDPRLNNHYSCRLLNRNRIICISAITQKLPPTSQPSEFAHKEFLFKEKILEFFRHNTFIFFFFFNSIIRVLKWHRILFN